MKDIRMDRTIFIVTEPIVRNTIIFYKIGNEICKNRSGSNIKYAQFHNTIIIYLARNQYVISTIIFIINYR